MVSDRFESYQCLYIYKGSTMNTYKELKKYRLINSDNRNYVYNTYIVNSEYAIVFDSDANSWMLIEYDLDHNMFGEVEYITYSLESLLTYIKEFIK